jgi:hypothetical protein
MVFKPQKLLWGGFHAQEAPNINIATHPRVTLSVGRSFHGDLPTLLRLLEVWQCTEQLPIESHVLVVSRPRCRNRSLHLFLRLLHLCKLAFNCYCDYERLIGPSLNMSYKIFFFVSHCIHCLFKCFGLLHSHGPLSEGHRLRDPFDIVILLL